MANDLGADIVDGSLDAPVQHLPPAPGGEIEVGEGDVPRRDIPRVSDDGQRARRCRPGRRRRRADDKGTQQGRTQD